MIPESIAPSVPIGADNGLRPGLNGPREGPSTLTRSGAVARLSRFSLKTSQELRRMEQKGHETGLPEGFEEQWLPCQHAEVQKELLLIPAQRTGQETAHVA